MTVLHMETWAVMREAQRLEQQRRKESRGFINRLCFTEKNKDNLCQKCCLT